MTVAVAAVKNLPRGCDQPKQIIDTDAVHHPVTKHKYPSMVVFLFDSPPAFEEVVMHSLEEEPLGRRGSHPVLLNDQGPAPNANHFGELILG